MSIAIGLLFIISAFKQLYRSGESSAANKLCLSFCRIYYSSLCLGKLV